MKLPLSFWPDGEQSIIEVTALNRNYIESIPAEQSVILTNNGRIPELAQRIQLHQNYPNPFNPSTQISFYIPEAGRVTLTVFDLTGRTVAELVDETLAQGTHRITFNGGGLSSGIYLYQLQTANSSITRKMTLVK